MQFVNGVRTSPFSQPHWTDGLEQPEIISELVSNGSAKKYLDVLSRESAMADHFSPIDRGIFLDRKEEIDDYLHYDLGAAMVLMVVLPKRDDVIEYSYNEVGSLIRAGDGIISSDVLLEESEKMTLNNAQLHELERLLNKKGRSLDIDLPVVPLPTEEEQYRAISHLSFSDIQKYPRRYYNIFVQDMLIAGTPVSMKAKEFKEFAKKVLKA